MNGLSIFVPRSKIVRIFYFQILPDARNNIPYNFLTTQFSYVRKSAYVVKDTHMSVRRYCNRYTRLPSNDAMSLFGIIK